MSIFFSPITKSITEFPPDFPSWASKRIPCDSDSRMPLPYFMPFEREVSSWTGRGIVVCDEGLSFKVNMLFPTLLVRAGIPLRAISPTSMPHLSPSLDSSSPSSFASSPPSSSSSSSTSPSSDAPPQPLLKELLFKSLTGKTCSKVLNELASTGAPEVSIDLYHFGGHSMLVIGENHNHPICKKIGKLIAKASKCGKCYFGFESIIHGGPFEKHLFDTTYPLIGYSKQMFGIEDPNLHALQSFLLSYQQIINHAVQNSVPFATRGTFSPIIDDLTPSLKNRIEKAFIENEKHIYTEMQSTILNALPIINKRAWRDYIASIPATSLGKRIDNELQGHSISYTTVETALALADYNAIKANIKIYEGWLSMIRDFPLFVMKDICLPSHIKEELEIVLKARDVSTIYKRLELLQIQLITLRTFEGLNIILSRLPTFRSDIPIVKIIGFKHAKALRDSYHGRDVGFENAHVIWNLLRSIG